jgi:biotin transporter BioY
MKKSILLFLGAASGVLLAYLAGSFVAASFDIRTWDSVGRFFTVLAAVPAGIIGTGLAYSGLDGFINKLDE